VKKVQSGQGATDFGTSEQDGKRDKIVSIIYRELVSSQTTFVASLLPPWITRAADAILKEI